MENGKRSGGACMLLILNSDAVLLGVGAGDDGPGWRG